MFIAESALNTKHDEYDAEEHGDGKENGHDATAAVQCLSAFFSSAFRRLPTAIRTRIRVG